MGFVMMPSANPQNASESHLSGDIQVGIATMADEPRLRHFIDQHWRANHPLSLNPWLLRWQHRFPDADDERLTFMVARRSGDDSPDALLGVLGFMPFRRFDPVANWSELALALWKVRPEARVPGLGIRLHQAVMKLCEPELVCVLGTTEAVRPLYRSLGYQLGTLSHAALFAATGRSSVVAQSVPEEAYLPVAADSGIELANYNLALQAGAVSISEIDALGATHAPRKSGQYVKLRYIDHPCYDYDIRLVKVDGQARALVIWRRVDSPSGPVLRIVDIVGDSEVIARCGASLRAEVERAGCEYLDVVCFGIDANIFRSAGFVNLDDHPALVLPNHFCPFKQANVRTGIAYKYDSQRMGGRRLRLFRADSDQDRPNENALIEPRAGFCA